MKLFASFFLSLLGSQLALGAAQVSSSQVSGFSGFMGDALPQADGLLSSASSQCTPEWLPTFGGAPGTDSPALALVLFDDGGGAGPALFVGGQFLNAGGVPVNRIR